MTKIVLSVLVIMLSGFPAYGAPSHVLYQSSLVRELLLSDYNGDISYRELKKHGDFGLGTFNGLDGEMIAVDGGFYQVRSDGKVYPVSDSLRAPFAMVTFFEADSSALSKNPMTQKEIESWLDTLIPTKNIFYAIKITGKFSHVKVRSVYRQEHPVTEFAEVIKNQVVFDYDNVEGVIVAFRVPSYAAEMNIPGYHFHFISADRRLGGHLLDCVMDSGSMAEIEDISSYSLNFESNKEFYGLKLDR